MLRGTILLTLICGIFLSLSVPAQKILRVNYLRFGVPKKYDFNQGDFMRYKIRGEHFLRTDKITNFHDSVIVFRDDFNVYLNEIKSVRVYTYIYPHLNHTFQKIFLYAGIGYPLLYAINGGFGGSDEANNKVFILSASFLLTSFLIKQSGIKRVRMKKNGFIRVLDIDYNNLNGP